MLTVVYDPGADAIYVAGIRDPYPAGSLVAVRSGDAIAVQVPHGGAILVGLTPFNRWCRSDGSAFSGADEAFAYLSEACTQQRTRGLFPEASYEHLATQDGPTTLTLPRVPGLYRELTINGLRQSRAAYALDGVTLTLPDTLRVMAGDLVALEYSLV